MATSESKLRAIAKYDKAHTTMISLKFNNGTDKDILEKLASVPNRQGYIKDLIRKDMASVPDSVPENESEEKKMKTYHIKPEYLDMWEGGDMPSDPDRIVTENDIRTLSESWGEPIEDLLEQLIPIN